MSKPDYSILQVGLLESQVGLLDARSRITATRYRTTRSAMSDLLMSKPDYSILQVELLESEAGLLRSDVGLVGLQDGLLDHDVAAKSDYC